MTRHDGRVADELRAVAIQPGFVRHRDRVGAHLRRRDARDLHGERAGERPALARRARARLGHRRVRDAARVDRRAQAARRRRGAGPTGARSRSSA